MPVIGTKIRGLVCYDNDPRRIFKRFEGVIDSFKISSEGIRILLIQEIIEGQKEKIIELPEPSWHLLLFWSKSKEKWQPMWRPISLREIE